MTQQLCLILIAKHQREVAEQRKEDMIRLPQQENEKRAGTKENEATIEQANDDSVER